VAFRDQSPVLREQPEAGQKEIPDPEEANAAPRAKQVPAHRGHTPYRGPGVVLGAGVLWNLGTTNRGLYSEARAQQRNVSAMRSELDRVNAERAQADLASVASEAACRERAEAETARTRERVFGALSSSPPTDPSPSRYFWIDSVRGRTDLSARSPCLVTLTQDFGSGGRNRCSLEAACGGEPSVALIPAARSRAPRAPTAGRTARTTTGPSAS